MIRFGWKKRPLAKHDESALIRTWLGTRSLVLVGLMGCGKSSIGRRLATALDLPFLDADDEIESAAKMTIPEIFEQNGEEFFRSREQKVIGRILDSGPQVLATGGGSFMNPKTRAAIAAQGYSIWLKAELPVLMRRVLKRDNRPLLKAGDPEAVMRGLIEARYPVYALADLHIESRDVPHEVMVAEIISALSAMARQGQKTPVDAHVVSRS